MCSKLSSIRRETARLRRSSYPVGVGRSIHVGASVERERRECEEVASSSCRSRRVQCSARSLRFMWPYSMVAYCEVRIWRLPARPPSNHPLQFLRMQKSVQSLDMTSGAPRNRREPTAFKSSKHSARGFLATRLSPPTDRVNALHGYLVAHPCIVELDRDSTLRQLRMIPPTMWTSVRGHPCVCGLPRGHKPMKIDRGWGPPLGFSRSSRTCSACWQMLV